MPGVLLTLDLEPLLRGALLEQMAAVLLRAELPEPERQGFALCRRCGELVPFEVWELGRAPALRCRGCLWRASERRYAS